MGTIQTVLYELFEAGCLICFLLFLGLILSIATIIGELRKGNRKLIQMKKPVVSALVIMMILIGGMMIRGNIAQPRWGIYRAEIRINPEDGGSLQDDEGFVTLLLPYPHDVTDRKPSISINRDISEAMWAEEDWFAEMALAFNETKHGQMLSVTTNTSIIVERSWRIDDTVSWLRPPEMAGVENDNAMIFQEENPLNVTVSVYCEIEYQHAGKTILSDPVWGNHQFLYLSANRIHYDDSFREFGNREWNNITSSLDPVPLHQGWDSYSLESGSYVVQWS